MKRGGEMSKEKVADGEWTKLPCNLALARTRKLRQNRTSSLVFIPNPLSPRSLRGRTKCLLGKTKSEIVFFYLGLGLFYLLLRASHKAGSGLRKVRDVAVEAPDYFTRTFCPSRT